MFGDATCLHDASAVCATSTAARRWLSNVLPKAPPKPVANSEWAVALKPVASSDTEACRALKPVCACT